MASVQNTLPAGWQDKSIVALAILLAVSPWLFGYSDLSFATWNAAAMGAVFAAGAVSLLVWEPYWPDFIAAFGAFWLVLSPRIFEFAGRIVPASLAYVVGTAVVVLALWSAAARARARYFAAHPRGRDFDPPVRPQKAA